MSGDRSLITNTSILNDAITPVRGGGNSYCEYLVTLAIKMQHLFLRERNIDKYTDIIKLLRVLSNDEIFMTSNYNVLKVE